MLSIEFLICTYGNRIDNVEHVLAPPITGVSYMVSWQCGANGKVGENGEGEIPIPKALTERADVRIIKSNSTGISANRNAAFKSACGDILVIADDDCIYTLQSVENIRRCYNEHPDADVLLFRLTGYDGCLLKNYPTESYVYPRLPRGAYISSCEITLRRNANMPAFNELFGVGAPYLACAEEEEWLHRYHKEQHAKILYLPVTLGATDAHTTGTRRFSDPGVARATGALHRIMHGMVASVPRFIKYALTAPVSPYRKFCYFGYLLQGAVYIGKRS